MEVATGVVKHVLLAKFKENVPPETIEEHIMNWANLVNVIEPMKDFQWGTNVSKENKDEGYTHVFVSTFESTEAISEYLVHPAHVAFAQNSLQSLEKFLVVDYLPTTVKQY
ncbi:putative protein Pop3 [Apostasia shenzhenica]|uniref:Stress-response A/B barrel domain-containing protein n=1 Tax=Apostasia shenzhenica TaxID=1088818 RepID=A0A2I0A050_9ASPA|nr:putative protein Pop3 [Apostasia shenzhenica]